LHKVFLKGKIWKLKEEKNSNDIHTHPSKERRYHKEHQQIKNWSLEEWQWRYNLKNQIEELIKHFLIEKNHEDQDEALQFKFSMTIHATTI